MIVKDFIANHIAKNHRENIKVLREKHGEHHMADVLEEKLQHILEGEVDIQTKGVDETLLFHQYLGHHLIDAGWDSFIIINPYTDNPIYYILDPIRPKVVDKYHKASRVIDLLAHQYDNVAMELEWYEMNTIIRPLDDDPLKTNNE